MFETMKVSYTVKPVGPLLLYKAKYIYLNLLPIGALNTMFYYELMGYGTLSTCDLASGICADLMSYSLYGSSITTALIREALVIIYDGTTSVSSNDSKYSGPFKLRLIDSTYESPRYSK